MQEDENLLRRLRAGDEDAFGELIARYDGPLRRVAASFVRTPTAVEEVVGETWLALVKGIAGFEGRSTLGTWLFRILVNRARTRGARDSRVLNFSALEDDDRPAVEPSAFGADGRWRSAPARLETDPESSLLSAELRVLVVAAIDALPEQQRVVVTLRDVVGLTSTEVCETLEITEVNQRVLLHRGRARCRAMLAAQVGDGTR